MQFESKKHNIVLFDGEGRFYTKTLFTLIGRFIIVKKKVIILKNSEYISLIIKMTMSFSGCNAIIFIENIFKIIK